MNKTVLKVFGVIALLVGIFIFWTVVFKKETGVLATVWNSVATSVNKAWEKVAGKDAKLIPEDLGGTGDENLDVWD